MDSDAPLPGPGLLGKLRPSWLALLVALAYLGLALPKVADYGPTWDFVGGDYPYGERLLEYLHTGDERLLDLKAVEPRPPVRAPHPNFELRRFRWFEIFPVGALLSAASCRLLWTELGLVPAMAAHHAVVPLLAAALVFVLTLFCARRWGSLAGVIAGGSLALNPVFFGHACHNVKDIAECLFYTGAVLAGFAALRLDTRRWWAAAGALTALALAQKANALFLPVQLALFLVGARWVRGPERLGLSLRGFTWMTVAFLVVSYAVSPAYWTAPIEGPRMLIGQMLVGGTGNDARIEYEAPLAALVTTPPITLLLALLGLLHPGLRSMERLFLLVGVGLPVARNLIPGMRHYDGTRHFIEFLPMLCALAGLGAAGLLERARSKLASAGKWRGACVAAAALALVPCLVPTLDTHPNQITYYNSFVGGLGGAQRRGFRDATDYWGNSYWQGLAWISANAEPGASLLVPVADHVARSAAPVRLRADVHLVPKRQWGAGPLYVMYITQPGRYGPLVRALEAQHEPVHEIRVQGAVILRIHRLAEAHELESYRAIWLAEQDERGSMQRILDFLWEEPDVKARVAAILDQRAGAEPTLAQLQALLPPDLHEDLERSLPRMLKR